jgi:preprotein translocase subunit SecG
MDVLLIIIHVIVCVALIMIVLLQTGKGTDMGAAFGMGSSQTLFGSSGSTTFLSKATTMAAVVFMLTSLILAYISGKPQSSSVMTNIPAASAPAETQAPPTSAPSAESANPAAAPPAEAAK